MTNRVAIANRLRLVGLLLTVTGMAFGIGLTLFAAAASGLNFWELAMLNKFGSFVLVWNYNPLAYIGIVVLTFTGFGLFVTGRTQR